MSVDSESEMRVSSYVANCLADERLPVVDVGDYLTGDVEARERLAVDLRAIQESLGFYCIVNHGVPQALIDRSLFPVRLRCGGRRRSSSSDSATFARI